MDETPGGTGPDAPGSAMAETRSPHAGDPGAQPAPPPPPPAQPPPPPSAERATGEPMPAGNPPAGSPYAGTTPTPGGSVGPGVRSPLAARLGSPILGAILAAAVLLAASLAVALAVVPPEVDNGPGSAAATVRAYVSAFTEGRYAEAYDLLDTNARTGMTLEDFVSMGSSFGLGEQQLEVTGVTENGNRAIVRARLTMGYQGLDDVQDVRIDLVRVDGRWVIDTPMYGLMPEPEF